MYMKILRYTIQITYLAERNQSIHYNIYFTSLFTTFKIVFKFRYSCNFAKNMINNFHKQRSIQYAIFLFLIYTTNFIHSKKRQSFNFVYMFNFIKNENYKSYVYYVKQLLLSKHFNQKFLF